MIPDIILFMPDQNEQREEPFGPMEQDGITAEEYGRAREGLRKLLKTPADSIMSLEELSQRTVFVGQDIRTVVISAGEVRVVPFEYDSPTRGKVEATSKTIIINKPVEDRLIVAQASKGSLTGQGISRIDEFASKGGEVQSPMFSVCIPYDRVLEKSDKPYLDASIFAVDRRSGAEVSYYPAKSPDRPQVLQGYMKVLQDGVRDMLAVTPEPTQIPNTLGGQ